MTSGQDMYADCLWTHGLLWQLDGAADVPECSSAGEGCEDYPPLQGLY